MKILIFSHKEMISLIIYNLLNKQEIIILLLIFVQIIKRI